MGYVKSALTKFREGNFDYSEKEREELIKFIQDLQDSLGE